VLDSAPHAGFPLQGLPSLGLINGEKRPIPIYAYEPVGNWAKLISFMPSLSELYIVFEKLLLCESMVVLAKSPQLCFEFVSAAKDLVRPVPYAGIVRPYVIMQSDFVAMGIDGGGTPRPILIGITNPFLLKRIIASVEQSGRNRPHVIYLNDSGEALDVVPLKPRRSQRHQKSPPGLDMPGAMDANNPPKRYIKTDSTFMKELDALVRRDGGTSEEVGPLVRRHFAELAAQFLSPIHRYLATKMSSSVISPGGNLQYANFSETEFIKSLSKHGTAVNLRGQNPIQRHKARDALYSLFCRSPNFYSWLDMKLSLEKEAAAGLLSHAPIK